MLLWIVFAGLTALAALAVIWPLARAGHADEAGEGDIAVYREQLKALDDEIARGLIAGQDAESARVEISRRMLGAAERAEQGTARRTGPVLSAGMLASVFVIAVAGGSLALYLRIGTPELPGQPFSARLQSAPGGEDIETLIARVEAHLGENPEDGQGWDVIAPVYLRIGRFDDAVRAFANAARILGETSTRLAGYGEALTQANGGVVTADARSAFTRADTLEPGLPRARFYLALALEQDGKRQEAVAAWQALLVASPADAPWRGVIEGRLAALGAPVPQTQAVAPQGAGPSAADIEAANNLSPEQRREFVDQMVGRLAARLVENGKDLDGWLRLARAYMVLGRGEEARGALASARENFATDDAALAKIKDFEAQAGLGG